MHNDSTQLALAATSGYPGCSSMTTFSHAHSSWPVPCCSSWAIPFIDRYGLLLVGWVAPAPVGIQNWGGPWEYTHKLVGGGAWIWGQVFGASSGAQHVPWQCAGVPTDT